MTLVEVMVVVTLTSILLGVVTSLLIALKQWDRNVHQFSVGNEQLARLAETMRIDIRQAIEVSLPTENALVVLSSGEKQTRYELTPEGCRRIVGMPGEVRPLTDLFAVGPAASWTLETGAPGKWPMIVVTLNRVSTDGETHLAPLLVYAARGADLPPQAPITGVE